MLNQSNDSADKTADQSVIELDEADSSITMLLHWKNHHHQNPTLPCTLEFSNLRVSDVKDNSMVSDTNFSDVCNVEEFDKNRERPAEKILDQLNETGNPAELSLDDPDLERLLDDIYSGHIAKPHWWHLGSWLYAFLGSSPPHGGLWELLWHVPWEWHQWPAHRGWIENFERGQYLFISNVLYFLKCRQIVTRSEQEIPPSNRCIVQL